MIKNNQNNIYFKKRGFIIFKNLVKKETCKNLLKKLESFNKFNQAKTNKDAVFEKVNKYNVIKYFKNIDNYIIDFKQLYTNTILNIASNLIKDDAYFLNMGLHNKPPGSLVGTPPHQDNFYWCRKPSNALTAYVALTDQSVKNGGIGYLPCSHLGKIHKHHKSEIKAFSSYIKLNKSKNKNFIFPKLKSGDVIFHHCKLIHVSAGNITKKTKRTSLAITIYGKNTKLDKACKKKYLKNFIK